MPNRPPISMRGGGRRSNVRDRQKKKLQEKKKFENQNNLEIVN